MRLSRYRSRGLRRGPFVIALVVVTPGWGTLVAQTDTSIRYQAESLACVGLRQSVLSELETRHGDDRRTETSGWEGDLVLRAAADTGGVVSLVAWFERLRVWRDIPEGRLEPATEGMLGGRYRGILRSDGDYVATATPFVPDAISAIAAMATALDELFPPLPGVPMAPGGTVLDPRGWRFDRLPDTTMAAGSAWRLHLARIDTTSVSVDWGDGHVTEGQSIEEEGSRVVWQPEVGPTSWIRRIATVVAFAADAASIRSVRTDVRQERRLEHLGPLPPERCIGP